MEVLAKRLKWLREQKRLSQKEVAAEIGMSLNGYQKIEMDDRNPKLESLINLSILFKETTDFLLGLSDTNSILNNISKEISQVKSSFYQTRQMAEVSNFNVEDLKRDLSKQNSDENKEVLKLKKQLLLMKEKERAKAYNELYFTQNEYGKHVIKYIETIINIPYSRPSNDILIQSFYPFSVKEEYSQDFDEEVISLYGKEIGFIGIISAETANELNDLILK